MAIGPERFAGSLAFVFERKDSHDQTNEASA